MRSTPVRSGWRNERLGEVLDICLGGTPSTRVSAFWGGDVPWMASGDVHAKIIDDVPGRITPMGLASSNARLVEPPAVAIALAGQGKTRGTVAFVRVPVSTNQSVALMRPRDSAVNASFVYHNLDNRYEELRNWSLGGGRAGLSRRVLSEIPISLPPLQEQERIAAVLDSLDAGLQAAKATHKKLQSLKQGLIRELLTPPGCDSDASVEAWASKATGGWSIARLEDLLAQVQPAMRSGPFGSALLKHELVASGVPLLGIDNVHTDRFVRDYKRFVTRAKAGELSRYRVFADDVMITIMGTVGRTCLVPHDIGDALSSKHTWTMTFDKGRYLPYLIMTQLNHAPWVLAQLRRDEQGGIMSAIRSDTLRSLLVPVPPLPEQHRILAVLQAVDGQIEGEALRLAKLRLLKDGLADALLSGRVRVAVGGAA